MLPKKSNNDELGSTDKGIKSQKASAKNISQTLTQTQPKMPAKSPQPEPSSALSSNSVRKKGPTSKITVKYDVGFSNTLYLRGKGANLSWDRGVTLKNVKNDEWVWETDQSFTTCEFKVLINDKEYEAGANHTLTCGASIQYTPKFSH